VYINAWDTLVDYRSRQNAMKDILHNQQALVTFRYKVVREVKVCGRSM